MAANNGDSGEGSLGFAAKFFLSLCALAFIGFMILVIDRNKGNFSTAANDPAWSEELETLEVNPIDSPSNEQSEVQSELGNLEYPRSEEGATSDSISESVPDRSQAQQTYNPSFDCGARLTNVEAMICQNEDLAIADQQLSNRYFRIQAAVPSDLWADVMQSQIEFLQTRSKCLTVGCISSSYLAQSEALDKMTVGTGG